MAKKKIKPVKSKVPVALKKDVLAELGQSGHQAFNYKQISARLGLEDSNSRQKVLLALEQLAAEGVVKVVSPGKYELITPDQTLTGRIDMTSTGAAYVVSAESEQDVYIPPKRLRRALDGDTVRIRLYARRKNQKPEGEVVEIIERKRTEFVGIFEVNGHFGFLVPDSRKMLVDIYIPEEHFNGAIHGQKCVAKITDWPERASSPFGEITRVLGDPRDHQVEIHAILADYGLPYKFPEEVEAEADSIPKEISDAEIAKRRDFRGKPTFTIDPQDAKDFDDALSIELLSNGNWEVGVHIADVTHYVKPDSLLEKEALQRATSVYLVDRVVPMLPEVLSNNLCSLRPHEDKCCFSAVFEIDENAQVKKRWFGRTLIHSQQRFAYEDAQAIIEGGEGPLKEEILTLHRLALLLRAERTSKGALLFDREEVKFILTEEGKPSGIYFKISKEANHLIEEFMLLANREVATFIGKQTAKEKEIKTFVYRIHDEPDNQKILDLNNFIKTFGYSLKTQSRKTLTQSMNELLQKVQGKGEANMIETLAIRSMAKAEYSTQNIGHYGLAFDYYTHFTSPIRRYPDMMVHRLLQHYLEKGNSPSALIWEEKCKHSSMRERLAAEAERASIKYMQVKYMQEFQGEEFDGIISGVTDWGVYVELTANKCEGMVRIRDFKDDYYVFDEKNYCIVGESRGRVYRLGDALKIRVKRADVEKKQLDFELALS